MAATEILPPLSLLLIAVQFFLPSALAPSFTPNLSPHLLPLLTVLSLTLPAACPGPGHI